MAIRQQFKMRGKSEIDWIEKYMYIYTIYVYKFIEFKFEGIINS